MEDRKPTSRSQLVSFVALLLAVIAVIGTFAVEVMMLFSDLGPGETEASRNSLEVWVLVVGGATAVILLAVSWFAWRRKA